MRFSRTSAQVAQSAVAQASAAFHAAAIAQGGVSVEEPPGWREGAFGAIYLAYVRDPDGHKLCAIFRPKA